MAIACYVAADFITSAFYPDCSDLSQLYEDTGGPTDLSNKLIWQHETQIIPHKLTNARSWSPNLGGTQSISETGSACIL